MRYIASLVWLLLGGCTAIPDKVVPITSFEIDRYLGTWYEIARLDHSFERGLSHVSAEYSLVEQGVIQVVNQGYSSEKGQWKRVTGKAKFVGAADTGHLKVSFFGPFYSSYIILDIDRDAYSYALVCGPTREYLWLLAGEKALGQKQQAALIDKAASLGFPVDELIFVSHQ